MIAVVIVLQTGITGLLAQAVGFSQRPDTGIKLGVQLALGNAANGYIPPVERNICQVVQITKHTYFAELCHAREECKTDVTVTRLQSTIKSFQLIAILRLQNFITDCLQHRLVVLIHQNDRAFARLLKGTTYHTFETGTQ